MHDVSVPAAVLAGLISFLSPCVLPILRLKFVVVSGSSRLDARAEYSAPWAPSSKPLSDSSQLMVSTGPAPMVRTMGPASPSAVGSYP